ncbi:sugar O-acetyltransferase [Christiangramia forsetii]|uniref:Acetyltransferase n=2 Tax=Christiangramia forsetii TaxID=411153 RepID=A0LXY4_CHRFK|nr:sugar O-acetyltransferase [Christiangramia forsetii]GGG35479.1 maltose acetyltransferase [Christiangramia forsetii]CAL65229.1 transferase of the hexapeptide-repeat family-most likely an acetyltransferase [Christiangramia forsetii KT0803]
MSSEKDKMLSQKPYIASDPELSKERIYAQKTCFKINSISPEFVEERNNHLKKLLGSTKENFYIEPPFHCDYGYNITLGKNFYSNYNCTILDCAEVKIGDNVMLAPNVSLFTAGHPIDAEKRNQGLEYAIPITIGNNVWIGGNTVINPGVNIGDNTVVGSGSVITKDIPANVIAAGNPCKVIREITKEDQNFYFKKRKF